MKINYIYMIKQLGETRLLVISFIEGARTTHDKNIYFESIQNGLPANDVTFLKKKNCNLFTFLPSWPIIAVSVDPV